MTTLGIFVKTKIWNLAVFSVLALGANYVQAGKFPAQREHQSASKELGVHRVQSGPNEGGRRRNAVDSVEFFEV